MPAVEATPPAVTEPGGIGKPPSGTSIGQLLREAMARLRDAHAEQPRLDAELLLGHVAGLSRTTIIAHPELEIDGELADRFRAVLLRRAEGEPVAYIRGFKEFYGLALGVDQRVLIPRPETELLVELAARIVLERSARTAAPLRIIDIGTGSGAVVIALAARLQAAGLAQRVELIGSDASAGALSVAAANLERHDLAGQVRLVEADLVPDGLSAMDLVLANLPYLPSGEISGLPVAASFEPRSALDGGIDGLEVIRRLLGQLPAALAPRGAALLEIGADQAASVGEEIDLRLPGWLHRIELDLSGLPRVVIISRGEPSS